MLEKTKKAYRKRATNFYKRRLAGIDIDRELGECDFYPKSLDSPVNELTFWLMQQ